ncbi:hypothetical protein C2G38_1101767 [Gigaspora rosea]|uniref:HCP-like protein n=1 Tax=Gigaspora rosea TaxID=44941 RepID=A0A397VNH5_9GLOM|nr:hypothetical protein C2G38_1101767 [Gigaspora rosea]
MSNYNNIFEKIDSSSEDNNLQDLSFLNEIVKEMCKLYNEGLKCKNSRSILETLEQFLLKKKQNPVNIIDFCLDDQTNPTIQLVLASCYRYGKWVEKDDHKAFNYYQKSAEMGDASGICNVGYCYDEGIGVEKDEYKAFIYFKKSAEMGNAYGAFNVGNCYNHGIGVYKDEHKAFIYYQKSAEVGDARGAFSLGACYRTGNGVEKDEHKAFIYYQKSAEMGDTSGMSLVAECYRNGIGITRDLHKAKHWYQREKDLTSVANKCDWLRNIEIDDNLKKILTENQYQLSWIPYDDFKSIKKIDLLRLNYCMNQIIIMKNL